MALPPLPPPAFPWTDKSGKPTQAFAQYMVQLDAFIRALTGGLYAGNLNVTGSVIAGFGGVDQVGLQTHKHGGVTIGGGTTSAPTAGT